MLLCNVYITIIHSPSIQKLVYVLNDAHHTIPLSTILYIQVDFLELATMFHVYIAEILCIMHDR